MLYFFTKLDITVNTCKFYNVYFVRCKVFLCTFILLRVVFVTLSTDSYSYFPLFVLFSPLNVS